MEATNRSSDKPIVWSIAGSDSGGGAGIQADLHTFHDLGAHGCTVITALTAQNSVGVDHVQVTDTDNLKAQIQSLHQDLPAEAIKIGMLANSEIIEIVATYLDDYHGIVVGDPVMVTTSGDSLLDDSAQAAMKHNICPKVDVLTPNLPEAEVLSGMAIRDEQDIVMAAQNILGLGPQSVLVKGGHFDNQPGQSMDYWTDGKDSIWLSGGHIDTDNTHGTGCTLSSALAALLARGYDIKEALVVAKAYITQGLRAATRLGQGPGPVAHLGWPQRLIDFPVATEHYDRLSHAAEFPSCEGDLGLYPIVDSAEWVERLLPTGVETIQLRIKEASQAVLRDQIRRAVAIARQYRIRLFVNDHWQLALEYGAYGVHLGQEDLDQADIFALSRAGLRLGISAHNEFEIARARAYQPSYIALGPVYSPRSKTVEHDEKGLAWLRRQVTLLAPQYTLTAIGGITQERASAVLATGVKSCAVISAITQSQQPLEATEHLLRLHQPGALV